MPVVWTLDTTPITARLSWGYHVHVCISRSFQLRRGSISLTHSLLIPEAARKTKPFRPAGIAMADFTSFLNIYIYIHVYIHTILCTPLDEILCWLWVQLSRVVHHEHTTPLWTPKTTTDNIRWWSKDSRTILMCCQLLIGTRFRRRPPPLTNPKMTSC